MASEELSGQLKRLPTSPGVYLFKGERDEVLYVGKAKSLRPRVRQYFQAGRSDNRQGMDMLAARTVDVDSRNTRCRDVADPRHATRNGGDGQPGARREFQRARIGE